jgi:GTP-binding protein
MMVSAKTGKGIKNILPEVLEIAQERNRRIPTAELNSLIREAVTSHAPPTVSHHQLRILYATQAETRPPTFIFFVNNPKLSHFSYKRYLENRIRDSFGFHGTPLKFIFKGKAQE